MSSSPVPPAPGPEPVLPLPSRRTGRRLPSGRHGLPRAFVSRNQRERVLDAVAHAVADKGYAATRVVDITDRAGVSRKTFYELFSDKEEAFLAAFDAVAALTFAQLGRVFEDRSQPLPWLERTRQGFASFLALLAAEPEFARMCLVEARLAGPRATARLEDGKAAFRALLAGGRAEVVALPAIPGVSESAVVAGLCEHIEQHLLAGDAARLPELLEPFMELVSTLWFGPAPRP
jgi:AcrR family transcriptional regulator